MIMGRQSNFKIAVNELMNGASSKATSEEKPQRTTTDSSSNIFPPRDNVFNKTGYNSVIAEDVVIEGSINGKSSIQINGQVKGNVTTAGDILSRGAIEGDAKGVNVSLVRSNIKGNVTASGELSVDESSIIVGDINAGSVEISGKIKGDIRAEELIVLRKAALVLGNLKAKSVSMEAGSELKGNMEVISGKISESDFDFAKEERPVTRPRREEVEDLDFSESTQETDE
jgi:cytoskeletal protein CcmA (bactofilin family)